MLSFLPRAPVSWSSSGQALPICLWGYVSIHTGAAFLAIQQLSRAPRHFLLLPLWSVYDADAEQFDPSHEYILPDIRTAALFLFSLLVYFLPLFQVFSLLKPFPSHSQQGWDLTFFMDEEGP